ncbi:hypothetical protein [Rubellimicrobium roseum]|uniref:Lipoprotein n=1 Tax=Rubellimicrobium roseum TaxID=687525 RepID=A0A5C4NR60_9RHOB|nr:hypothetical protein [Rubellimicrobium roseum]TNC74889.1 hypothetical protein FHG71_01800 [Rubellimicrobium roseum]
MAQLLRAVVAGVTLATTGALLGCPDWTASLTYVTGMAATLMAGTTTVRRSAPAFRPGSGAPSVG